MVLSTGKSDWYSVRTVQSHSSSLKHCFFKCLLLNAFFPWYNADGSLCIVTFLGEHIMAESSIMRGGRRSVPTHTLPFLSRQVLCLYNWFTFQKVILPGINICTSTLMAHTETQGPYNKIKEQGAVSEQRWSWGTRFCSVFPIWPQTAQKIEKKNQASRHRLKMLGKNSRSFKLNEYTGIYWRSVSGFS